MSERLEFEQRLDRLCGDNGWLRAGETVELKFEDGRGQEVHFELFDFEGVQLVRLFSTIGSTRHIEPARLVTALRLNFGLARGAMAVRNEELVVVDTTPADDDSEDLASSIRYLAETADHFERTMFGSDSH